ncbi:unnamed protein product [Citrullus colocynthis]|uniref:Uncharacterized protein n=1 Tax=Citrullus colocynthis TaxID=252529 RepID=A0ABP0Z4C1_9ROSI
MKDVIKMRTEKKQKLKEEIEEYRSTISRMQKEMTEKEKEIEKIEATEQMLGIKKRAKTKRKRDCEEDRAKKPRKAKERALQEGKRLPVWGKTPSIRPLTINGIQTKQERQEQLRLTKRIFDEEYTFLTKYTEEDKITSIYPADSKVFGPKAVALPEADPLKVFMLFQSGLVHTIYFNSMDIFRNFPIKMKRAIQLYAQRILVKKEGFLRIFSTTPEFDKEGEVIQPAIQLCKIGSSNSKYPVIGEAKEYNEIETFLNSYSVILQKGVQIKGRINYSAKSIIIWSLQSRPPMERDIKMLGDFLLRMMKNEYEFSEEVKKEICIMLQQYFTEDHICKICEKMTVGEPLCEEE